MSYRFLEDWTFADVAFEAMETTLEELLLRADRISIAKGIGRLTLDSTLRGEAINPTKHELVVDVKAVTHHRFEVRQENSK